MAMIAGARVGGQPYESVFFFFVAAAVRPVRAYGIPTHSESDHAMNILAAQGGSIEDKLPP
jgi:hypothetical protein